MTLVPTSPRFLSIPPTTAGLLLFVASIVVALGVFSANRADLDGILFAVAVMPASLSLMIIAEDRQGSATQQQQVGYAVTTAGLAVVAWSAFEAWDVARLIRGAEPRYFLSVFLPHAAIGVLLVMAGLIRAGIADARRVLIAGIVAGAVLATAAIVNAAVFATGASNGAEAKTFLAAMTVPLTLGLLVVFSALRYGDGFRDRPNLSGLGFLLILGITLLAGTMSAATAEHRGIGDFFGPLGSGPDATIPERLYAFTRLTVFPIAFAVLLLTTGPHRRSAHVAVAGGFLLAFAFAIWAATGPSVVPLPPGSVLIDIRFISSPFWVFAGVLIWHVAVYALALSRAQRQLPSC